MKPGIEAPFSGTATWLASAIALVMTVYSGQAAARNAKSGAAAVQEGTAQQKPVKLRYFGGPKSAMSSR